MNEENVRQMAQQLFSFKTIFFGLGIGVIIYVIRLVIEGVFPILKKSKITKDGVVKVTYPNRLSEWWNTIILYLIPVVIGAVVGAFAEKTFWPEFVQTKLGGIFYGSITGWASGFIYSVVRKSMSTIIKVNIGDGPEEPKDLSSPSPDVAPDTATPDVTPDTVKTGSKTDSV
jgi:hypothetical protein